AESRVRAGAAAVPTPFLLLPRRITLTLRRLAPIAWLIPCASGCQRGLSGLFVRCTIKLGDGHAALHCLPVSPPAALRLAPGCRPERPLCGGRACPDDPQLTRNNVRRPRRSLPRLRRLHGASGVFPGAPLFLAGALRRAGPCL